MELPSYFDQYLCKIQPSRASRERAIQLHTTLRQRLEDEVKDDLFKSWYTGSFLYGSYIRNTAIQPIKDVDVCILLDLDITKCTPESVVRRLRRVAEDLGYKDKVAYQRRSIRIDMAQTTLDLVPVIALDGDGKPLRIPDRPLKQWVYTHPKGHIESARRLNSENGKRYIPFVKIVKAWYRYQAKEQRGIERPKPKGFTLEALVAQYQDTNAPSYAEAFVNFLQNLLRECGRSLRAGIFPSVRDPGQPNESIKVTFSDSEARLFAEIAEESLAWAKSALAAETIGESATNWRLVFGSRFPDAPVAMKSLRKMVEEPYGESDPLLEEEIEELGLPPTPVVSEKLQLKAWLASTKEGLITGSYPSNGEPLGKSLWLKFSIAESSIRPPFIIHWHVHNHGKEAQEANQLYHSSVTDSETPYQWESTMYRGSHTLTCEIHKSGVVVAKAVYKVNIR